MPVSSHLTEYYHVFHDGSTARLAVSPWTRDTLADGYWINENTIKPLSARDVYLAECIQDLSAQDPVYKEGSNVKIVRDDTDGQYIITIDPNNVIIPKFDSILPIVLNTDTTDNIKTYSLNIGEGLKIVDDKLCIDKSNIEQKIQHTTATSSYMDYQKQEYKYTYTTANLNYVITGSLPLAPEDGKLYIIG